MTLEDVFFYCRSLVSLHSNGGNVEDIIGFYVDYYYVSRVHFDACTDLSY